jgi:hypothetical protein
MPETQIVLIYVLATLLVTVIGGLAFYAMSSAKSRIIREQRRALEVEQRLRRAQESFTDNAHHELRTPVQILSGYVQMLGDLNPTEAQADILQRAGAATTHLEQLVQGLLDLSSLGQGTLSLQATLVDLGAHLATLGRNFETRAQLKGLAADVALAPLPRPLFCDATRLSQSLEALLDNALGFADCGQVGFRLKAHAEGSSWHLRFEIEDQGPGLSPDWPRFLHPFEQEDYGLRRRRGGLGIGLPLAAGIIELMGGRLGLDRRPVGTLAWVEISLEEAEP